MTLELYVLRQLLVGLCFAAGGMTVIAIPGVLVNAVQKLSGVGMAAILGFVPLVMLELMPYLLPIGFLLALVATYGRLAADNEWTAINMAGHHPLKMLRPAALLALVLSGVLYWFATEVSPQSNFQKRNYQKSSVMRMLRTLNPGGTSLAYKDFYLSARERDPENRNRFVQVILHMPAEADEPERTLFAHTAEFSFQGSTMVVDLTSPRWIGRKYDARVGYATMRCDLDRLFETDTRERSKWKYQSSRELRRRIERSETILAAEGEAGLARKSQADGIVPLAELRSARFELHSREALSAICPMFLLLGVPTGLLLRRGSQLGALATAVVYALVYYLLSMRLGKGLALSSDLPQWLAAWGTTIAGSTLGVVLTWFALRK